MFSLGIPPHGTPGFSLKRRTNNKELSYLYKKYSNEKKLTKKYLTKMQQKKTDGEKTQLDPTFYL